jgi:hypothetical protein
VSLRRQLELLPEDELFLKEYGLPWETVMDGSPWVLIHDFPTRGNYNHPRVTAAIRMETGYPNTALDMVYFSPGLARLDGRAIGATESMQLIDRKPFQRWSRHRTPQNPWVAGRDNLGTHIILIEDWLEREFRK